MYVLLDSNSEPDKLSDLNSTEYLIKDVSVS